MTRPIVVVLALLAALADGTSSAVASNPHAPPVIRIGEFSSQASPARARAGADIAMSENRPGRTTRAKPVAESNASVDTPPPVLTLSSTSSLLQNPHPMGPGTLWYQGPLGQQCVYAPSTSPLCFAIVGPNGGRLDPSSVAAAVAQSMDLVLPPIEASPSASRDGLTGDASWFWLDGAPREQSVTVRLGAELVTVTADPSATDWSFGDGAVRSGGAGVAYRPGAPPADAITHVYETRCLPGDQGRDPNVLASCGGDGYAVAAQVRWTISFTATGPIAASGALPARTTESSLVYPVSEARAFLVAGGSQ
jgi:hypothetical protein